MVNATEGRRAAERRLILSYARAPAREGIAALLALDDTLGQILRTTREPLVGQMRLTWWHEALVALDGRTPPAEPVLRGLAGHVLPAGVRGADLARMVEGWEALLDPLDRATVERAAAARGEALFGGLEQVLGVEDRCVAAAGRGWALADFARGLSDPALAEVAAAAARGVLDAALGERWPVRARAIGALVLAARMDLESPAMPPASPGRVGRLLWHRTTGR